MLGNWQFSAINTATSGQPANLIYNVSSAATVSSLLNYRPNVAGNPVTRNGQRVKTATQVLNYLDPNAVSVPTNQSITYGNAGRNSIRTYPFYQLDTALHKGFHLWNEASLLDSVWKRLMC